MNTEEFLRKEMRHLGDVELSERHGHVKCQIVLREKLAGVKKFFFVFRKTKSNFYHPLIWKKDYVDFNSETATILVAFSRFEINVNQKIVNTIKERVDNQVESSNAKMLAFTFFSTISALYSKVKRPKFTTSFYVSHDIKVPVMSSEGVWVMVPVEAKSSIAKQQLHLRRYKKTPSVVINSDNFERLLPEGLRLLNVYVEQQKIEHIH